MSDLLIPKIYAELVSQNTRLRVTEAISAKRREKVRLRDERVQKEKSEAQERKFSAFNDTVTSHLANDPEYAKKREAFRKEIERTAAKQERAKQRKEYIKGNTTSVVKTRADGHQQRYNVRIEGEEAKELDRFRPVGQGHVSISPNKGEGVAILSKGSNDIDDQIPDITHDRKGSPLKEPLTKDAKRKEHIYRLIQQYKKNPPENVVNFLTDAGIDALISRYGEDALKNIKQVLIPPITKAKLDDGTFESTLTHKLAESVAKKLDAYYDPHTLGVKTFETKKLPFDKRMQAYGEYFSQMQLSEDDFLDGDTILMDDIMTTGTTAKAIHENLAGYRHENREGSKTSGTVSSVSRKLLKGRLLTLAVLKNY